ENTLCVIFESPYEYAEKQRAALGERPGAYDEPYQFIRKMACNFGWDWGPTVVTSGIWRPLGLSSWSGARLAEVRPLVEVVRRDSQVNGKVTVHTQIERERDIPLDITVTVGDVSRVVGAPPVGQSATVVE